MEEKKGLSYNAVVQAYENEQAFEERNKRCSRLMSMTHLLLSEAEARELLDKTLREIDFGKEMKI